MSPSDRTRAARSTQTPTSHAARDTHGYIVALAYASCQRTAAETSYDTTDVLERLSSPALCCGLCVAAVGAHDIGVDAHHLEPRDLAARLRPVRVVPSAGGIGVLADDLRRVQPRAIAIKEAVLSRRMPPWGAVKGFGSFRNDQSADSGTDRAVRGGLTTAPRGNNRLALPKEPTFSAPAAMTSPARDRVRSSGHA